MKKAGKKGGTPSKLKSKPSDKKEETKKKKAELDEEEEDEYDEEDDSYLEDEEEEEETTGKVQYMSDEELMGFDENFSDEMDFDDY